MQPEDMGEGRGPSTPWNDPPGGSFCYAQDDTFHPHVSLL